MIFHLYINCITLCFKKSLLNFLLVAVHSRESELSMSEMDWALDNLTCVMYSNVKPE